jgi:hypothetical protein
MKSFVQEKIMLLDTYPRHISAELLERKLLIVSLVVLMA